MRVFSLLLIASFCLGMLSCKKKQDHQHHGPIVRIPLGESIRGLDPAFADDQYSSEMIGALYEGLMGYELSVQMYKLVPNLLEKMPTLSNDRKTLILKLKKGVLFSDDPCFKASQGKGRELIADDVVYSWMRLADPTLKSGGWFFLSGKLKGLDEWREQSITSGQSDYNVKIEGLTVLDRYSVRLTFNEAQPVFLHLMAHPYLFIVPREALEHYGTKFSQNPVGTGPFLFAKTESDLGSKVRMIRNPQYHGNKALEDLIAREPKSEWVGQIEYRVYQESQSQWADFIQGNLDVGMIPGEMASKVFINKKLNEEFSKKGIYLMESPALDFSHLGVNLDDPILGKSKALRQAMSLAIDTETLVKVFYGGQAIESHSPVPPGIEGYDPRRRHAYHRYDIQKASRLLVDAGYMGGKGLPKLDLLVPSGVVDEKIAQFFLESMKPLGIRIQISKLGWKDFLEALRSRKYPLWLSGWVADYPDALNFLQLFYSRNRSPGPNHFNFNLPFYDELYEKALAMVPTVMRQRLIDKMVDLVNEEVPWIFGVHRTKSVLISPPFQGFRPEPLYWGQQKFYRMVH